MPTWQHLTPQNWLPWQDPLTKVQIVGCSNFFINGVVNNKSALRSDPRYRMAAVTFKETRSNLKKT